MRKPGIWAAKGQPDDPQRMYSWQPGAVASFYEHLDANQVFAYKQAHPDVPIIVRFQHPPAWLQNPTTSAQQLGQRVIQAWDKLQPLDPYIYFASHLNMHYENGDPNPAHQTRYTTPAFYQKYAEWVRTTADVIKSRVPEMKLVTPPFAFGFNEDGSPNNDGQPIKGWAGYDFLRDIIQTYFDNILTFHAFWGYPAAGSVPDWLYEPELSSWYAFRWQRILQMFQTRYGLEAKLLIDEAGSYGPADPDFTEQLLYYAEQCLSDPRVLALTYFIWSDPSNTGRYRLNSWVEGVPDLTGHLNRLAEMTTGAAAEPATDTVPASEGLIDLAEVDTSLAGIEAWGEEPAPAPQQIRVLFEDGQVQTMPLEEYLRSVIPSEVPALWPMEALKAQTVAARSYARYAIDHPRHHPQADICTTTHCQHYEPNNIHPRTDQAIQETAGQMVLYQGEVINTVFSARCGGHTRNNEDVWKGGRPVPYLRGVSCPDTGEKHGHGVGLCQHGARVFAKQGRAYDEIIRHYYQGTSLGPAPNV